VSVGIAHLFFNLGTRRGCVVSITPRLLLPQERPGTHCTGGWVGPGAGLDRCGKSPPTGIRSPDLPARSELLYRLRYPGSLMSYTYLYTSIFSINTFTHTDDPYLIMIFKHEFYQCHCTAKNS
jgi:hypothetical protein